MLYIIIYYIMSPGLYYIAVGWVCYFPQSNGAPFRRPIPGPAECAKRLNNSLNDQICICNT